MAVRAVLGDDDLLARQKLRRMLAADTAVEVVGEGASALEILEVVRATAPQLLFLDVCMPGADGFALLNPLQEVAGVVPPRVIFTTAWDACALRASERNAVDYLLKPFTAERLRLAVDRARAEITSSVTPDRTGSQNGNPYTTRIAFKSRGRMQFLPVSDIRWIGAEENYVRICTKAETHLLRQTMADLEGKLDPARFARVHRRYLTPTWSTVGMALVSIVFYVAMTLLSTNVLNDTISSLGLMIALYYGLTGLACAWWFRKALRGKGRDMVVRGVMPLSGGLTLLAFWG